MRPVHAGMQRDQNEREIMDALEEAGYLVRRAHEHDLVVSRPGRKNARLLEVKMPKGTLTKAQRKMIEAGWPLLIVRTPREALAAVKGL